MRVARASQTRGPYGDPREVGTAEVPSLRDSGSFDLRGSQR